MKCMFSIRPGNQTPEHAVENKEFNSAKKSAHVSLTVQDHVVCFFDHKGIVHYKFIAQGQMVKQQCYLEVMTRLWESVQRKRPELWPDEWILQHDNVPVHYALRVCKLLAKKSITKMDHPPYSPDLAPLRFLALSKIKKCPEGTVKYSGKRFSRLFPAVAPSSHEVRSFTRRVFRRQ
jgi:hypothetical protein